MTESTSQIVEESVEAVKIGVIEVSKFFKPKPNIAAYSGADSRRVVCPA